MDKDDDFIDLDDSDIPDMETTVQRDSGDGKPDADSNDLDNRRS